ncbi:response regulator SirA [bacterium]|nr:response regulator SirA [bacterium]
MVKQEKLFQPPEYYKINKVIKRNGRIVAFNREKIVNSIYRAAVEVGGKDWALAERLADQAVKLINQTYPAGAIPPVEEIQDLIEKVLVEKGCYQTAKHYILYRAEHARLREGKIERVIMEDNIPYKVLWHIFTWNVDHKCDTIENLNKHIRKGTFPDLVKEAEEAYHLALRKAVEKIMTRINQGVRLVIVAGPSSSGKTTTTLKIGEILNEKGVNFYSLSLDNYFKNLEEHPKDEYGDYDFESPQALDLPLINEHLSQLLEGKRIEIPRYNFKTGKRMRERKRLKLEKNQILLIDSLHGLYPEMTSKIPPKRKFKFYIEVLCQLRDKKGEFVRWADLRMLRRMVRDSWHRSYDPERTVGHWHYVRRSEKKHIVPFTHKVDYVFNGSLPYELPIYKKYLSKHFPPMVKKYEKDPKKIDAYIRAKRVYNLLSQLEVADDRCVPSNSLLREFIGGSSYKY